MKFDRFPGWAGPIVGPIAGAALAYKFAAKQGMRDDDFSWQLIAGFAAAGLVAGLVVWALDRRSLGHQKAVEDLMSRLPPDRPGESHEASGPTRQGS